MSKRRSYTSDIRCPQTLGTGCISYEGADIPCLGICIGATLTELENAIALKICDLVGMTDMTEVVLPACLITAFGTKDENILNFIQFLLDQHCLLQTQVDGLPTTNNPIFTLDYKCCSDNVCLSGVTVTVSEHLQNILICLCSQNDRITTLETQFQALSDRLDSVSDVADEAASAVSSWTSKKACILAFTDC